MDTPKAVRKAIKGAWKALKREQRDGAKARKPEQIADSVERAGAILASIRELAARLAELKSKQT